MMRRTISLHAQEGSGPVLIVGATVAGRNLVASAVHAAAGRRGPLVRASCRALPPDTGEAVLFGTRADTYSIAGDAEPGLIETAARGSLWLDDIELLAPAMQVELLRVVEEGTYRQAGARRRQRADVLLLVGSAHDPLGAVTRGLFHPDLYHHLARRRIVVPDDLAHAHRLPS